MTLNPHLLDVVKRDADYAIVHGAETLTTPAGFDVACESPRPLEHIVRELTINQGTDPAGMDAYGLFSVQKDWIEEGGDPVLPGLRALLREDPLVQRKMGVAAALDETELSNLLELLESHGQPVGFAFGGFSGLLQVFNDFLVDRSEAELGTILQSWESCEAFFGDLYLSLPSRHRAAVTLLSAGHRTGLLLPFLMVMQKLTPSEYANAAFSIHLPRRNHFSTHALGRTLLPGSRGASALPDWSSPRKAFAAVRHQAAGILEYLSCFEGGASSPPGTGDLIRQGESFHLEFKATLRWNLKAGRKDPAIEHASLKTVCAFLNSSGGTLLIGVNDDGSIEGIEKDGFPNEDRFAMHFWNLVEGSMGQDVTPFLRTSFEKLESGTVFAVRCQRSPRPVFLRQKGFEESFYIRVGPSSANLGIQEAIRYIGHRFTQA